MRGQLEAAVEAAKKAIELDGGTAQSYMMLGRLSYGVGKIDESIAAFRNAVRVSPDYMTYGFLHRHARADRPDRRVGGGAT